MTDTERAILDALGRIKLGKFNADRGFVADLQLVAQRGAALTPRQTDFLYSLRHKYRAQIDALEGPPVPGAEEGRKAHERWREGRGAAGQKQPKDRLL